MSKLIRHFIDLLEKQYILEHILLSCRETIHAQPFIFLHLRNIASWLVFQIYIILCLPMRMFIHPCVCVALPDFIRKNKGCLVKFGFQISNK